ncbi:Glycoside hydrolase family 16 protein [Mycena kentingensis (nom. inval.)]|nr:Glycoside hydrolase family 16 protein [Mycena kentingensis (nom. inval.)]
MPPPSQYPFAPSSNNGAPQVGPNAQRRYFQQPNAAPSSANLLPSSKRLSGASDDSFHSSSTHQGSIQPSFARGPSIRSTHSGISNESRYAASQQGHRAPSVFSLSPDPAAWGADINHQEPDDFLHNPDPKRDRRIDNDHNVFTFRGLSNLGCLLILGTGLITLLCVVCPVRYCSRLTVDLVLDTHSSATSKRTLCLSLVDSTLEGPTRRGRRVSVPDTRTRQVLTVLQVPEISTFGLIDLATPKKAYTMTSYHNPGEELQLVFSDEFETDGRSFYPGDDPYWEAVDLHYWGTNNLEWYDPAAITTKNGALEITLSRKETHDLNYQGGMMSTWNKFCFTGGLIVSSVSLPGTNNVHGLWPAIWTMGNLGRAGFGASLDGMWPYSYDSCDVGTAPNQTINGLPLAATINGDPSANDELSFLPGQRLSRCTCPGESHPGPIHSDGTYVGRAAPEIDIFEAQISNGAGQVSQSCQWAPFNNEYKWFNTSDNLIIPNLETSVLNSYLGGAFQQATSVVSDTNQRCYQLLDDCFSIYGFEYKPGFDGAYISWITDDKLVWTLNQNGMDADTAVEIGDRPIPQEPMYIIANLGMSLNFGAVDFERLIFPATMRVDYIRVYQPKNAINIGCDPADFPTQAYINEYIEAYTNANLTTWVDDFKQPFPRNKLTDGCA